MNYYEEMGVPESASAEEIREAYRNLVRLLHPDQFQDLKLKDLAERQLKRVNGMHEVLSDPERRVRYDLERRLSVRTPLLRDPPPPRRSRRPPMLWLTCLAVFAAGCALFFQVGRRTISAPSPAADPLQSAETEPAKAPRASQAQPPAETGQKSPPAGGLAGTWFYLPPMQTGAAGGAGDYVEAVIAEHEGRIRGLYRTRYLSRLGPQEVVFLFEGAANDPTRRYVWTGAGGARGEIYLKPLSRNLLAADWLTTEPGETPQPRSGAAVLVRRQSR